MFPFKSWSVAIPITSQYLLKVFPADYALPFGATKDKASFHHARENAGRLCHQLIPWNCFVRSSHNLVKGSGGILERQVASFALLPSFSANVGIPKTLVTL
jgi:hypothetical protein